MFHIEKLFSKEKFLSCNMQPYITRHGELSPTIHDLIFTVQIKVNAEEVLQHGDGSVGPGSDTFMWANAGLLFSLTVLSFDVIAQIIVN
jgi:hypothetical protein